MNGHSGPSKEQEMARVKVWDLFVRLFHWALTLAVLAQFLTSEKDRLLGWHVRGGLLVLALVLARVAWGFLGPAPARFASFVRSPREVLDYGRRLLARRPPVHEGHNPLGGAMVVALLAVLVATVATGAVAYAGPEFEGALTGVLSKRSGHMVKELHEGLSGLLAAMAVAHVAGVLFSSFAERQNLPLGMLTGWKRAAAPARAPPARIALPAGGAARLLLSLAVGVAGAAATGSLLGLPARAAAASPVAEELLRDYEAAARKADASFRGFSAEEGRRIYLAEHAGDGERASCSACHTPDPRQRGRTPAGKVVDPLAPSANPARLTDRADVEKWFKRNCKEVLGRECTAAEKGHFLAFIISQ